MNWYKITEAPNYAINEDGTEVMNVTTGSILRHRAAKYAPDNKHRITLYKPSTYIGKTIMRPKTYLMEYLKKYITDEYLIRDI